MGEATNKMNRADWNESEDSAAAYDDSDIAIASDSSDEYQENTDQLRAEIEDTRADMSQTINEIQERLSPDHLMNQVKETVREATIGKVERVMERVGQTIGEVTEPAREMAGRAGETLMETGKSVGNSVWRNPIPVALIGVGLGMIAMRTFRKGNGHDYQPSARSVDTVRNTASNLASRSTEAISDLGTKAKDQATAVGSRFGEMLRENPLAVGAVAVAAGTAVGLILPSTRLESEYLGETSEMLVDKAGEVARGAIDKVQDVAQQAGGQQ